MCSLVVLCLFLFQKNKFRRFLVCFSFLLTLIELCCCVQVMVRCPVPTYRFFIERIPRAARLQLRMLPVGVEDARIVRIYRRWLRRSRVLDSPWIGRAARRLDILRIMTVHRTSGFGKFCFGLYFEVWVLLSKGVYSIPKSLTLFLSLSFGGVVDWRERFLADLNVCLPFMGVETDVELLHFGDAILAVTFG